MSHFKAFQELMKEEIQLAKLTEQFAITARQRSELILEKSILEEKIAELQKKSEALKIQIEEGEKKVENANCSLHIPDHEW